MLTLNLVPRRTCIKCGKAKPVGAFRSRPKCRAGLRADCADCCKAWAQKHYAANREKIKADAKARYHSLTGAQRDARREAAKAYNDANAEHLKGAKAAWEAKNAARLRVKRAEYYLANKERWRASYVRLAADPERRAARNAKLRSYKKRPYVRAREREYLRGRRMAERMGRPSAHMRAIVDGVEHKVCRPCDRFLPLNAFHKRRSSRDGRSSNCAECATAASVAYHRKMRFDNRYRANRRKAWQLYHARKRRCTTSTMRASAIEARVSVFGWQCAYCNGPYQHLDHLKPLSRGGPHILANLRPSCARCNQRKSATPAREWLSRMTAAAPMPLPG